ncbi:MAG: DUF4185 domain-containing protein [Candidatus Eremiobacteraeota bacterium]|nr:DUF4185 domain-containing protein [Candidatus Eremiobacteraeota bacterium]
MKNNFKQHSSIRSIVICIILLLSVSPISLLSKNITAGKRFIVTKPAEYSSFFQRNEGWTGADGDYSVTLSKNKILWIYGDTWIGKIKNGKHIDSTLVNNSIAIQHGKDPRQAKIKYYWKKNEGGKHQAFITPTDGKGWYWFYDGVRVKNGLYLFLMQIDRTEDKSAFGFKSVGNWVAYIPNPDDSPEKWQIKQHKIPFSTFSVGGLRQFGSAVMKHGDYVYIYGAKEEKKDKILKRYMIVARVKTGEMGDFDKWRFYTENGWSSDYKKCKKIIGDIANEYSVTYMPDMKKFIAIFTEGGLSPWIVMSSSENPYGPWDNPERIYKCPEADNKKGIFCYAAKAHPQLLHLKNELIVTYITNTYDFKQLENDASLYWPIFIKIKFK